MRYSSLSCSEQSHMNRKLNFFMLQFQLLELYLKYERRISLEFLHHISHTHQEIIFWIIKIDSAELASAYQNCATELYWLQPNVLYVIFSLSVAWIRFQHDFIKYLRRINGFVIRMVKMCESVCHSITKYWVLLPNIQPSKVWMKILNMWKGCNEQNLIVLQSIPWGVVHCTLWKL